METSDPEKGRIPEWYYQLQIEFGKKLHRAGRVAEEFRRLCQDGCDPRELEHRLFKLTRLPRQRFAKKYTSKHLQKLLALAARLIKTSKELDFFDALLVYASIGGLTGTREFLDWERPVEIPKTLTRLAERLKQCAAGACSSRRAFPSLYDAMPPIVEYVRSACGRPHHRELATLIAYALERDRFTPEELKRICVHRKGTQEKR